MASRNSAADAPVRADLVLEGGGVKGIGLVGALGPLTRAGYRFERIAGTSAGAIVGAVLAALEQRGEPVTRLEDIARTLDYRKFRDRGFIGRRLGPLGFLVDGLSVLFELGAFEGDYLEEWLGGVLGDLGVETFGDLVIDDPGGDGELHHRYRLMVTASDVSRRRLCLFPWHYPDYGLDPDEQRVVDAVRASASVPYLFEPVQLKGSHGTSTLVDGGLISNYPIDAFDRSDRQPPRWPTIGVRLDALGIAPGEVEAAPVKDPVSMGIALIETAIEGCQAKHVLDPCNVARSVYIDASALGSFDFSLSEAQQEQLLEQGRLAAEEFLRGWDHERWLRECRPAS
ncbi:MAG TPA: patatin-like phospholipase family protein [Marmoricola sp.]|nr:patatin-like phospholipase family protein [Marmoricola sp.]